MTDEEQIRRGQEYIQTILDELSPKLEGIKGPAKDVLAVTMGAVTAILVREIARLRLRVEDLESQLGEQASQATE